MTEIALRDIANRFGSLVAVNDLNLHIRNKEFVVLLGPSGCGKTTTLRCISGLETPDEGKKLIDEEGVINKGASQKKPSVRFPALCSPSSSDSLPSQLSGTGLSLLCGLCFVTLRPPPSLAGSRKRRSSRQGSLSRVLR